MLTFISQSRYVENTHLLWNSYYQFLPVWNLNDEDFFVRRGTFIGDAISASVYENGLDIGLEERSAETTGSEPVKCETGEEPVRRFHGHEGRAEGFGAAAGFRPSDRENSPERGTFRAESSGSESSGQECSGAESPEAKDLESRSWI